MSRVQYTKGKSDEGGITLCRAEVLILFDSCDKVDRSIKARTFIYIAGGAVDAAGWIDGDK